MAIHSGVLRRNPANSAAERFVHLLGVRYLRLICTLAADSLRGRLISGAHRVTLTTCAVRRNLIGTETEVVLKPPQHHLDSSTFVHFPHR